MDIAKDERVKIDEFLREIGADNLLEDVLSKASFPAEVPYYFTIRKGDDGFSLNLQDITLSKVLRMLDILEELEESAGMDACWLASVELILRNIWRKIGSPYWSLAKGDFTSERVRSWYAKECTVFL